MVEINTQPGALEGTALPTLEKFDTATIKENIEGKIRSMVVELIPDEAWKSLVAKEVDRFLGPVPKRTGYEQDHGPKVAKEVIREIVLEKFKAAIAAELEKPEYAGTLQWDADMQQDRMDPSEFVQRLVKDNLDQIVALVLVNLTGGFIQRVVDELRNQMAQKMGNM